MPAFTTDQLTIALAVVGAVAVLALILGVVLAFRLRKVRRQFAVVRVGRQKTDLLAALGATKDEVGSMQGRVDDIASLQEVIRDELLSGLKSVGLVRYDAFDEMGGRLSFSAALLNGRGDGLVITSINGRTDTRCYAKEISAGSSVHNLSEEELEAIELASSDAGRPGSTVPASQ